LKTLTKTVLAIAFALILIQVLVLVSKKSEILMTDFRMLSVTGAAAGLYYFIFERKRKN